MLFMPDIGGTHCNPPARIRVLDRQSQVANKLVQSHEVAIRQRSGIGDLPVNLGGFRDELGDLILSFLRADPLLNHWQLGCLDIGEMDVKDLDGFDRLWAHLRLLDSGEIQLLLLLPQQTIELAVGIPVIGPTFGGGEQQAVFPHVGQQLTDRLGLVLMGVADHLPGEVDGRGIEDSRRHLKVADIAIGRRTEIARPVPQLSPSHATPGEHCRGGPRPAA